MLGYGNNTKRIMYYCFVQGYSNTPRQLPLNIVAPGCSSLPSVFSGRDLLSKVSNQVSVHAQKTLDFDDEEIELISSSASIRKKGCRLQLLVSVTSIAVSFVSRSQTKQRKHYYLGC